MSVKGFERERVLICSYRYLLIYIQIPLTTEYKLAKEPTAPSFCILIPFGLQVDYPCPAKP
jgi:hypothetical protein